MSNSMSSLNPYYSEKPKSVPAFSRPSNRDVWSIGFDSMWDIMERMSKATSSSAYPPYNIIRNGDYYCIEVAVAGFTHEDLTVTVEENMLRIEGAKPSPDADYVHKGIGTRSFSHRFLLGEYVIVSNAALENGILAVELYRRIPEEKKPRSIEIH